MLEYVLNFPGNGTFSPDGKADVPAEPVTCGKCGATIPPMSPGKFDSRAYAMIDGKRKPVCPDCAGKLETAYAESPDVTRLSAYLRAKPEPNRFDVTTFDGAVIGTATVRGVSVTAYIGDKVMIGRASKWADLVNLRLSAKQTRERLARRRPA